jgi:molecular chaperone DnaK
VKITEAQESLKEAVKSNDTETIKTKTSALQEVSMKLGEAVYKAQQESAKQTDEQPKSQTVDAEFTEVKDTEATK